MPELPEAERARQEIERVLGRRIVAVDDTDAYVCRPHPAGEIAGALTGGTLVAANRRGKFIWAETAEGHELGLHLGMAGHILVDAPPHEGPWDRFSLTFEGGGRLALRDRRRLGRAVLNPDWSHIGPDAYVVGRDAFRKRVGTGSIALKAKIMDQSVISGVGNLLADQALWQARFSPLRPAQDLSDDELDRLRREIRLTTRRAIRLGGVHTGEFIGHRQRDGHCPRCGTALARAAVGGRTTYWCPTCQS